jgi:hypothetical protein
MSITLSDERCILQGASTDLNALLGQDVTNIHLTAPMVAASLSPKLRSMAGERLARGSNNVVISREQLAHKFQADASAGAQNKPCGKVLVGV